MTMNARFIKYDEEEEERFEPSELHSIVPSQEKSPISAIASAKTGRKKKPVKKGNGNGGKAQPINPSQIVQNGAGKKEKENMQVPSLNPIEVNPPQRKIVERVLKQASPLTFFENIQKEIEDLESQVLGQNNDNKNEELLDFPEIGKATDEDINELKGMLEEIKENNEDRLNEDHHPNAKGVTSKIIAGVFVGSAIFGTVFAVCFMKYKRKKI